MYTYTVIAASEKQVEALLNKHLKPFMGIPKIISKNFSYDDEDDKGFVTLYTITGKKIKYQLRDKIPMFVEFSGFGNIRYDISYPDEINTEMYEILKKYGGEASDNFWNGGQI